MRPELSRLERQIGAASGPDDGIDRAIGAALDDNADGRDVPSYTASVDACIALIHRTRPGWHWHIGHGATGIVPYASMTRNDDARPTHVEVTAPTVPLALLGALIKALNSD